MQRTKRILLLIAGIAILIFIYFDVKSKSSLSIVRPSIVILHSFFGPLRFLWFKQELCGKFPSGSILTQRRKEK